MIGGRFELEEETASGASGVVYRARDTHTGRTVALKLLATSAEAGVTARVRHPAIAAYVAHGEVPGGPPWLAIEWIEGVTLAERLRAGPLGHDETVALVRRVAEALGEVHRHGLVHGDVKPSNLILEGGDPARVRLVDFGTTGAVPTGGTPAYQGHLTGASADLYALGLVLRECCDATDLEPLVEDMLTGRLVEADAVAAALAAPARLRGEQRLTSVVVAGGEAPLFIEGTDHARRAVARARELKHRGAAVVTGLATREELEAQASAMLGPPGSVSLDPTTAGLIERTVLGRPSPLVGRELEIGVLESTFREQVAAAVLIEGHPGVGKSRLIAELVARASEIAPLVLLSARADPFRAGSPYALVAEAVRRVAGIDGAEEPADRHERLRQRLGRYMNDARTIALIGELADPPFPDEELRALRSDAVLLGDAVRGAWEAWLAAETAVHPVVIALDDLQWGDRPSVALVDHALHALPEAPLFVVAAARPEVHDRFPQLWAARGLRTLRLGPLSKRAAGKLVRAALTEAPPAVVERVLERGEGNPFFLEELVRQVAAGKADELPETVVGTVQARLDTFGPEARRVLRAASVFGAAFDAEGVAGLLGDESPVAVAAWLEELARREVIMPRPGRSYDFAHELVREAAYAMVPRDERVRVHRLAGEWLEFVGTSDAIALAGHFERGGELERAAAWYRRGAEQALGGDDLEAAVARAELGIAMVPDGEPLGGLLLVKAEALRWRGDLIAAERHAAMAVERLIPGSATWFHAIGERIEAAVGLGSIDTIEEGARRAAEVEPQPGAREAAVVTLCRAAAGLYQLGRRPSELLALAEKRAEGLPPDPLAEARLARVRVCRALAAGDADATVLATEAQARAIAAGDLREACLLEIDLGHARAGVGDLEGALRSLEEARAAAARMGLAQVESRAWLGLGEVRLRRGELDEARALLARAAEAGMRQRDRRLEGAARTAVALLDLERGAGEAAARAAEEAVHLLADDAARRATALAALALAQKRVGEMEAARDAAEQARGLLDGPVHDEALVRRAVADVLG